MTRASTSSARAGPRPIRRLIAFAAFIVRFFVELAAANLQVARVVLLRRVSSLSPGFLSYPLDGLTPGEILLLSHCITLTPGTTSVEISEDQRTLLIHALEADDPAAVRHAIKTKLEAPLLAWTR